MQNHKKRWQRPYLGVLVNDRIGGGDALQACKVYGVAGSITQATRCAALRSDGACVVRYCNVYAES